MQVIQNYKTTRKLASLQFAKIYLLEGESGEGAIVVKVRPTLGKIFIKSWFFNLLIFIVIAITTESKGVSLCAWSFYICNFNWKVKEILFSLKWPEKSIDELNFIGKESSLWVLNLKDSKIVVIFIHLLKQSCIDLIFQLGNTQILNLNRVCDSPFTANRNRRKGIYFLLKL
jgi:hypothetical protein